MEAIEALDSAASEALVEHVARVKHDLGKYVAFQSRWIAPDAPLSARIEALTADLVATRRGPEGTRDAPSVWADLRPVLVGEAPLPGGARVDLSAEEQVRCIDREMAVVQWVIGELVAGRAGEEAVREGTRAALAVADACRELVRRVRHRSE